MDFHPIAEIFPMMDEAALDALAESIKQHGLKEAIWVHRDGRVVDGRNRVVACERVGVTPMTRVYQGSESGLIEFVVALNFHRRHLNESQRALISGRVASLKHGQRADYARAEMDKSMSALTVDEAAKLMKVSPSLVAKAKRVLREGTEQEVSAIERGEASVAQIEKAIARGEAPERRTQLLTPRPADARGRRLPVRPIEECMDRGLDQLENTIEALGTFFARPDAERHGDLDSWVERLEKSRTKLTRLINQWRTKAA